MGSSATFSLSSLMCEEGQACFFEDLDENPDTIIDSLDTQCFVLEDEEEYIEYLFRQETGFGSQNQPFLASDDRSNRNWLRSARVDAIDWIFNVCFRLLIIIITHAFFAFFFSFA